MELEISGGKKCGSAEQLSRRWWSNEVDANREKNNTHTRKMKHITRKWKPLLYLNDTFLCSFVVNNVKHGGALLSFTLPYSPLTHSPRTHTHSFTRYINRGKCTWKCCKEKIASGLSSISVDVFFLCLIILYSAHEILNYAMVPTSQPATHSHALHWSIPHK